MKFIYLTALIGLHLPKALKSPIELKAETFITNNRVLIAKFLKPTDLMTIGSLESSLLLDGSLIIYKIDDVQKPELAHIELVNFLREVQAFLASLWINRDNSVNCEQAFAISQSKPYVHSNSLALHYSCCSGQQTTISTNESELNEVAKIHKEYFCGIREQDKLEHTAFQKETGRLNVSTMFLQQARSSSDLGQKIANYCSFFEALLSTRNSELAHQLAERSAFLLKTHPNDRLNHFKATKRAYAIRSKIVHGDVVSKKQIPDLLEIAQHCDSAARGLLKMIISDSSLEELFSKGENDALDEFILNRIFGIA